MFRLIVILIGLILPFGLIAQENDSRTVQRNKQHARTSFISYSNIGRAFKDTLALSRNTIDLSGLWKFRAVDANSVSESTSSGLDISDWSYLDINTKWQDSEVGVFRTNVEIPGLWLDKEIFLVIGMATSEAHLYVNGVKVGWSHDSSAQAQYEISRNLIIGYNEIAIVVFKDSIAENLENNNSCFAGIYGDVYIMAQPECRINDFELVASMDENYIDGRLDVKFELSNSDNQPQTITVGYDLIDQMGDIVTYNNREITVSPNASTTLSIGNYIISPQVWSAENPYLYKLLFRVRKDGLYTEFFTFNFGFKNIEIIDNELNINNFPVKINGVNYSHINRKTGESKKYSAIKKDIALMKQYGINAVRTVSGSQSASLYELCNEYGIYVFDELNISPSEDLGNSPKFSIAYIEKARDLYLRNRNYTSVIAWLLSANAGSGYNLQKTYNYLNSLDTIRPVARTGAGMQWDTDFFFPNYPKLEDIEKWDMNSKTRPNMISDYSPLTGNTSGDIHAIAKTNQSGFLYDWDKVVTYSTLMENDSTFVEIVKPNPILYEMQKAFQTTKFEDVDMNRGKLRVINMNNIDSLSKYKIVYHIVKEGIAEPIAKGNIRVPIAPQDTLEVQIPVRVYVPQGDKFDYYVNLFLKSVDTLGYFEKGTIFATGEIAIPVKKHKPNYFGGNDKLKVVKSRSTLTLSNSTVQVIFDIVKGTISSYKVNAVQYVNGRFGISPTMYRDPTPTDRKVIFEGDIEKWKAFTNSPSARGLKYSVSANHAVISTNFIMPNSQAMAIEYKVFNSGAIKISAKYLNANSHTPLRVGMEIKLDTAWNNVTYFGRGPNENYSDSNKASLVGTYLSEVNDMGFKYADKQENGHRTDTKWIAVGKGRRGNSALLFVANSVDSNITNSVTVGSHTVNSATFGFNTEVRDNATIVNIDGYMQGIGSRRKEIDKQLEFSFTIVPIGNFNKIQDYTNIKF